MAAATGMSTGVFSDSQDRGYLGSTLTAQGIQQQRDYFERTPPTFLVTQSLVSLLTEKGIHCYTSDRAESETNGKRQQFD